MGNHLKSLIIGIAIVLTALIFSLTIINLSKQRNSIYVTGLGSKDFTSDLIVWNGTLGSKPIWWNKVENVPYITTTDQYSGGNIMSIDRDLSARLYSEMARTYPSNYGR